MLFLVLAMIVTVREGVVITAVTLVLLGPCGCRDIAHHNTSHPPSDAWMGVQLFAK